MAWRIISSGKIVQEFAEICMDALVQRRLPEVTEAISDLYERLSSDPLSAGEPHNRLKHLGLILCTAFRGPITVRYAVDEQRKWVYLRSIIIKN